MCFSCVWEDIEQSRYHAHLERRWRGIRQQRSGTVAELLTYSRMSALRGRHPCASKRDCSYRYLAMSSVDDSKRCVVGPSASATSNSNVESSSAARRISHTMKL